MVINLIDREKQSYDAVSRFSTDIHTHKFKDLFSHFSFFILTFKKDPTPMSEG
jgi:hypothetical protein